MNAPKSPSGPENIPKPVSPETESRLPIMAHKFEIIEMIKDGDTGVVIGETGSGKSTQMPLFLLRSLPEDSKIAVTQPRRVAARSVAKFVASEYGCKVGEEVGYSVRFDDVTTEGTRLTFMTDGLILRKLQNDPMLEEYDVVVVDEAHERSLNIDLTLGLLKQTQKKRAEAGKPLKLIVTSATLEKEKIIDYLSGAKSIEVPGRMHPVDIVYESRTPTGQELFDVAKERVEEIVATSDEGNILIFMPGKFEIDQMRASLERSEDLKQSNDILELYGEMSPEDQDKIFASGGKRKIIISTNIAETSVTVPGLKYVVDSGLIRQTNYNPETGIESLDTVYHSKAGAKQRAGRAGRLSPGTCYRLYSEDDFTKEGGRFPDYSTPELLRSELSHVVLTMKKMGIQDVRGFDFIDPPERVKFDDAIETLKNFGALDQDENITPLGERMAAIPLEPHMARMVIEAEKFGCVEEVVTATAFLSARNVFNRPKDKEYEADQAHQQFKDGRSDFITFLNVWYDFDKNGFSNAWAQNNFLNGKTLREIGEIRSQVFKVLKSQGIEPSFSGDPDDLGRCLASGLVDNAYIANGDLGRFAYSDLGKPSYDQSSKEVYAFPGSSSFHGTGQAGYVNSVLLCKEVRRSHSGKNFAHGIQRVKLEWLLDLIPQKLSTALSREQIDPFSGSKKQKYDVSDTQGRYIGSFEKEVSGGLTNDKVAEGLARIIISGGMYLPGANIADAQYYYDVERRQLIMKTGSEALVPTFEQALAKNLYGKHFRSALELEDAIRWKRVQIPKSPKQFVDASVLQEIELSRPADIEIGGRTYKLSYMKEAGDRVIPVIIAEGDSIFELPDSITTPRGDKIFAKYNEYSTRPAEISEVKRQRLPDYFERKKREYRLQNKLRSVTDEIYELSDDEFNVVEVIYATDPITGEGKKGYLGYKVAQSWGGEFGGATREVFDTKEQAEQCREELLKILSIEKGRREKKLKKATGETPEIRLSDPGPPSGTMQARLQALQSKFKR